MREVCVFVLTDDQNLADWLIKLGGKPYTPRGMGERDEPGGYMRSPKKREWDIYIHTIPVLGTRTIHQAAGKDPLFMVGQVDEEEVA